MHPYLAPGDYTRGFPVDACALTTESPKNPDGPLELYDITKDIGEKKNIAKDHPEIVAEMARIMKAEHVDLK